MTKDITEESEKLLIRAFRAMEMIEIKGRENLVHAVNVIDAIQAVLTQINTPPEEGEKNKEE